MKSILRTEEQKQIGLCSESMSRKNITRLRWDMQQRKGCKRWQSKQHI
jgi:superfamily II DNA/RNA helicase